ncbi:MAG TPA: NTF2 fold immunity protein [Rhizomicrobium sp.]|nr:NTF2 fold immunity protein [Rhizomicrobium sp.]
MSDVEGYICMLGYEAFGTVIAKKELALVMAEYIVKDIFGEDDFKTQLPFKIEDGGDRWIINGSRKDEDNSSDDPLAIKTGPVTIVIRKANCQVLKFSQMAW